MKCHHAEKKFVIGAICWTTAIGTAILTCIGSQNPWFMLGMFVTLGSSFLGCVAFMAGREIEFGHGQLQEK